MNTAGGKLPEPTPLDALKSIRPEDFRELHKKPCVRDAMLTGIGSGFAVGGTTAIFGSKLATLVGHSIFADRDFHQNRYGEHATGPLVRSLPVRSLCTSSA